MKEIILELTANAFDVVLLTLLFCRRLPPKYPTPLPTLLTVLCAFVLESLPTFFKLEGYPTEFILIVLFMAFLLIFRRGPLLHKVFWEVIAFGAIFAIAYTVFPTISYIVGMDPDSFIRETTFSVRVVYIVIVNIIKSAVFFVLSRRRSSRGRGSLPLLICILIPVTGVVFMTMINSAYMRYAELEVLLFLMAVSYLVISCVSLILYEVTAKSSEKLMELRGIDDMNEMMARYTKQIRETDGRVRVWQHDMKHHMNCLSGLINNGDYAAADRYLKEVSESIVRSYKRVNSGNYLADAVLSSMMGTAEEKGISVSCEAALPEALSFSEVEFCALLSNLLENAVEACSRTEGGKIDVKVVSIKDQLYVYVSNTSSGDYSYSHGELASVKRNGRRGVGLSQDRSIVESHDGLISVVPESDSFTVEISIPLNK